MRENSYVSYKVYDFYYNFHILLCAAIYINKFLKKPYCLYIPFQTHL